MQLCKSTTAEYLMYGSRHGVSEVLVKERTGSCLDEVPEELLAPREARSRTGTCGAGGSDEALLQSLELLRVGLFELRQQQLILFSV